MARTGLKAEVANSYLNWIWWVLEPLASMLIYYFIFSRIIGRDQPYYVTFIYTGTLLWSFYERCMLYAVQAVRLNRDIVTKIYVPKPMLLMSNMLFNNIKMLISVGILAVVLLLQRVPPSWTMLYVVPMVLLMQLFTFGCGLILMHFGVFVDDLTHAMRIALRIFFYVSGVFYDLRKVLPGFWGTFFSRANPIAVIIQNTRNPLLYGTAPEAGTVLVWAAVSAVLCLVGLKLSYTYENTYVKII